MTMDTDLYPGYRSDSNSDKLTITHADVGTHYVQIRDLSKLNGIQVTGEHKQLLITDASGKLTFEGKEFNAGGLWDVEPTLSKGDALGQSANNWYLTNIAKTANNDTSVLLDAADNSYAMWRNTNDSLRSRRGALATAVNTQTASGRGRRRAGSAAITGEGRYNLYQFGFEKQLTPKASMAALSTTATAQAATAPGSGKDKLQTFSLYGVWTGDNGAYTNVTAR